MSYLVLARKWRPQTFDEIRGQEHIARALRNAISSGRIAHAYVFTGIRGVGKTSAARVLAKALNCSDGPTPTPCNRCDSCREITDGKHPDVLEIDGASNTGVEDVRKLREAVRYPPQRGAYRIYIIDEVHMLSTAAFNALLKTLEEPPPHVVFVFATTDAHKIPLTILSRCQQYDFKRLSPRELMALLADVCRSEGIGVDEKSLIALAREADGSVRDAQSLLDQVISYAGQNVSYEEVRDVLGVGDRDTLLAVARAVLERDPRAVLERISEAERFGYDARRFAVDLLDVFRDLAVLRAVEDSDELVDLAPEEIAAARSFLPTVSWEDVHARFDMLSKGLEAQRNASRPAVVLEMTLLKMAKLPPVLPLSQLLSTLGEGPPTPARGGGEAACAPSAGEAGRSLRAAPAPSPTSSRAAAAPAPRTAPLAPTAPPGTNADRVAEPEPPEPEPRRPVEATELWRRLLAAVEGVNRPFWTVLKDHVRLGSWEPEAGLAVVTLDDPGQEFFVRPKLDTLQEALRRLAGPRARVELRTAQRKTPAPIENDRARQVKKEALEHTLVREALEIFDAEVEEVRPLRS